MGAPQPVPGRAGARVAVLAAEHPRRRAVARTVWGGPDRLEPAAPDLGADELHGDGVLGWAVGASPISVPSPEVGLGRDDSDAEPDAECGLHDRGDRMG